MNTRETIAIVGAGYAGILCANRLARADVADVVLINDRDDLVHRVRLHEVAAGHYRRRFPLRHMLSPRVRLVRGRAVRIDAVARTLVLDSTAPQTNAALSFDRVVLASGSGLARPPCASPLPGARALVDHEEAAAFARVVAALPEGAHVVVAGAGATGLELAAELKEAHARLRVTLVGALLSHLEPAATASRATQKRVPALDAARAALAVLGVVHLAGAVIHVDDSGCVVEHDNQRGHVDAAALVWATGFSVPGLARASGLPVDDDGRLIVDDTLRVPGHDHVFGCGDAARAPASCAGDGERSPRMACATAMPMGAHVADSIVRAVRGHAPLPLHIDGAVQCLSLGRRRGLAVLMDRGEHPTGRLVTGFAGAVVKESICRGVIGALRLERYAPVYRWPGQHRVSQAPLLLAAPTGSRASVV